MCRETVTSRPTNLLIVALDTFREVEVDHKADIGLVDAHAKGDCGNDDLRIITDEGFLIPSTVRIFESRVIRTDRISFRREIGCELIHLFARKTVNNA